MAKKSKKKIMKIVKLSSRKFSSERAIALTRLAGAADLIAAGTI